MSNVRFVGMDVHKDTITVAVAEAGTAPAEVIATIPNELGALLRQLRRLAKAGPIRCCYEAGPTGTVLCRELRQRGIDCVLVAPSMVPHKPGDHVKTDRRDAVRLARFFRSGDLVDVYVHDAETEALRDLVRARDQAKRAECAARHHIQSFLLRQGRVWSKKTPWTREHMQWVRAQSFDHEAHHRVLVGLVVAVEQATDQVARLTQDLEQLATSGRQAPLIRALQAMRGIKLITAAMLATEVGDFTRFRSAPALAAYLGLVPSENSSGLSVQRGRITRTGNGFARRALVEAAWAYRHRPGITKKLKARQQGVDQATQDIAYKAQLRLCSRFRLLSARGKIRQQVVVALARELTGFIWAIARQPHLHAA